MTLEADLYARLGSLVANRVYPLVAPIDATYPCIVYQQVGGESYQFFAGEIPSKKNARMQIRTWAQTHAAAVALGRSVEDSIVAWQRKPGTDTAKDTSAIGAFSVVHEEDLELFGTMQDFYITYTP